MHIHIDWWVVLELLFLGVVFVASVAVSYGILKLSGWLWRFGDKA